MRSLGFVLLPLFASADAVAKSPAKSLETTGRFAPTIESPAAAPGPAVCAAPAGAVPLSDSYRWWRYVPGASWRHPFGPSSDLAGRDDYPVVHVAYPDAEAYAAWAHKRLPTEAEFEFAARGGLSGETYVWGDEFRPRGKWMANTWQGKFPVKDTGEDGYPGLAPVAKFPANGYGLYDM